MKNLLQKAKNFIQHPLMGPVTTTLDLILRLPTQLLHDATTTWRDGYLHGRKHGLGKAASAIGAYRHSFFEKNARTPRPWDTGPRLHQRNRYIALAKMNDGMVTTLCGAGAGVALAVGLLPTGLGLGAMVLAGIGGLVAGGAMLGPLALITAHLFPISLLSAMAPIAGAGEIMHSCEEAVRYIKNPKGFTKTPYQPPAPAPVTPTAPATATANGTAKVDTLTMDVHALPPEDRCRLFEKLTVQFAEEFDAVRKKRIGDIDPRVKKSTQTPPMPEIKKSPFPMPKPAARGQT